MLPEEKTKLLALFSERNRWCQDAEAKSETGHPVHYSDPCAAAWDITGGMCLLFGWRRALELFPQVDRHVHQIKRSPGWATDPGIASMSALQDFNDEARTTFEIITERIETMPVWNGHRQPA